MAKKLSLHSRLIPRGLGPSQFQDLSRPWFSTTTTTSPTRFQENSLHDKSYNRIKDQPKSIMASLSKVNECSSFSTISSHLPPSLLEVKATPELTKIVATIGPTSEQLHMLQNVVRAGMCTMRLNFSHATVEEVELRMKNLKMCKGRHGLAFSDRLVGRKNLRSTLLNTRGPEIRTGKLRNDTTGKETIYLEQNAKLTLRTQEVWRESGSTAL